MKYQRKNTTIITLYIIIEDVFLKELEIISKIENNLDLTEKELIIFKNITFCTPDLIEAHSGYDSYVELQMPLNTYLKILKYKQ